ncbi:hypothetical protein SUDANB105_07694 [Streptomyces sp. enrichment culture]
MAALDSAGRSRTGLHLEGGCRRLHLRRPGTPPAQRPATATAVLRPSRRRRAPPAQAPRSLTRPGGATRPTGADGRHSTRRRRPDTVRAKPHHTALELPHRRRPGRILTPRPLDRRGETVVEHRRPHRGHRRGRRPRPGMAASPFALALQPPADGADRRPSAYVSSLRHGLAEAARVGLVNGPTHNAPQPAALIHAARGRLADHAGLAAPGTAPRRVVVGPRFPQALGSARAGRDPHRIGSLLRLATHGTRRRSLIRPDRRDTP